MDSQTQEYYYFAFISYKREDEKWAKWLQKKLESYSLPSFIHKENPGLPKKIRPVFVDKSELSGGILKTEIENALDSSKFLIVVCSPNSAKSVWVSKEVQFYIDKNRERSIIPFIIGGVPNAKNPDDECFPESLKNISVDKELLGININEMGREAAVIKVISYMLNVKFDRLWQRYRKDKKKRNIIITTIISVLMLAFMVLFIVIWKKNVEIDSQNSQLISLVNNLKEENRTFSQMRNQEERYSYVGSLRGAQGEHEFWAIAYHPYKPIMAFVDDWGVWLHNINTSNETFLLTNNKDFAISYVEWMNFSADGSKLVIASFEYTVINIENGQYYTLTIDSDDDIETALFKLNHDNENFNPYSLDDLNKIIKSYIEIGDAKISVYKGKEMISTDIGSEKFGDYSLLYNEPNDEVLILGENRISVYDDATHEFAQFFRGYDRNDVGISKRGDILRLGKDLFIRNSKPETVECRSYTVHPIKEFPKLSVKEHLENIIEIDDQHYSIKYTNNHHSHKIEVVKEFSMGSVQESVSNAIFAHPDEIIVIMEAGKHRIYNAVSEELVGVLENYADYSHLYGMNVLAEVRGRDLYVVSADGTFCIYNIDSQKLKRVVTIPVQSSDSSDRVEKCTLSKDGKIVSYSFENDSVYYKFQIP